MDEKMNLTEKNISIKTTNGTVVNVTCSYAEDKTLEALFLSYLEQRKTYEQLLVHMQNNIEKQKAVVIRMAQVDLPEVAGFEMLEGQMKLQKLNKEIVDAFVAEIVVYDRERVELKWKFRDEFVNK